MTKILKDIEKLAAKIAEHALRSDTPLHEQTEALKLLTPYYSVLTKSRHKPDEPTDEPTMGALKRALHDIEESADDTRLKAPAGRAGRN